MKDKGRTTTTRTLEICPKEREGKEAALKDVWININ